MRRLRILIAGFIMVCGAAGAADLTGTWVGQLPPRQPVQGQPPPPGPPGRGPDIVFRFTQSGTNLTGKQYGDYRSSPLSEGNIEGDRISFTVITSEQAGSQTNTSKYGYVGTIEGDEIKVTRERESSVNVGNGEIAPNRNGAKQTFTLKRLT